MDMILELVPATIEREIVRSGVPEVTREECK